MPHPLPQGMCAVGVGGADAVDVMAGLPWELKAPKARVAAVAVACRSFLHISLRGSAVVLRCRGRPFLCPPASTELRGALTVLILGAAAAGSAGSMLLATTPTRPSPQPLTPSTALPLVILR